jgi:DNA topoisomerase-1
MSIDVDNNFAPTYVISKDKKKVVSDLKNTLKSCSDVILAADEDREGEAIAASLADVLKLKDPKRIVFNEITKTVLMNALKNPRKNVKKIKR